MRKKQVKNPLTNEFHKTLIFPANGVDRPVVLPYNAPSESAGFPASSQNIFLIEVGFQALPFLCARDILTLETS
jgi:hypothetical protein